MTQPTLFNRLSALLRTEFAHLIAFNRSERVWQMPFAAALASGLPLFVGAYFDHLHFGLVSSLGGLVFLYMPATPLYHRMVALMACAFGMSACYALGMMSQFVPPIMMLVLTFICILVTMTGRYYGLGPPGSLFFVMAAAIGAYTPIPVVELPLMVGLLTMGCLLACLVGFFYSVYILRVQAPQPVTPLPVPTFDFVIFDSVVIGLFVGIALLLAQMLQLQRAYWVPVSCLAVIQGMSLRAVWNKQVQRIAGTAVGLLLSWAIISLPLNMWAVAAIMTVLAFLIESLVVRHYGLAVVFITPLTIMLVEAAHLGQGSPNLVMQARFVDTVLGSVVGLLGGVCLHSPKFRETLGRPLRRLLPERLFP